MPDTFATTQAARQSSDPPFIRPTLAASVPAVGALMPGLLQGTLAVRLRSDLGFDETALGVAVASVRATAAISAIPSVGHGQRLFVLSMVRANPNAPAAGVAITRTGGATGGVVGPFVFGLLAQHSYALAWRTAGARMLLGAVVTVFGRWLVIRDLGLRD